VSKIPIFVTGLKMHLRHRWGFFLIGCKLIWCSITGRLNYTDVLQELLYVPWR